MSGTDDTLIIVTQTAGIIWKEAKLVTSDLTSQQQMLTAQLSTSTLLCISSHCVDADLMSQQNTQQQEKSMLHEASAKLTPVSAVYQYM